MKYIDLNGNRISSETFQDKLLQALYGCAGGRLALKALAAPVFSQIGGAFLNSSLSRPLIRPFIEKNKIDMSQFENRRFLSYNDFFTRRINDGERPFDKDERVLISPCDCKASCYELDGKGVFKIKGGSYTCSQLLKSSKLAEKFKGGYIFILRLCVDDYHRYCWCCSGQKSRNRRIKGFLYTVNPAAFEHVPVFKENSREYCVITSETFGKVIQMEVGATMVGKINNYLQGQAKIIKGGEKGRFEFGGSTIVVMVQPDMIKPPVQLLENTADGFETIIRQGTALAISNK